MCIYLEMGFGVVNFVGSKIPVIIIIKNKVITFDSLSIVNRVAWIMKSSAFGFFLASFFIQSGTSWVSSPIRVHYNRVFILYHQSLSAEFSSYDPALPMEVRIEMMKSRLKIEEKKQIAAIELQTKKDMQAMYIFDIWWFGITTFSFLLIGGTILHYFLYLRQGLFSNAPLPTMTVSNGDIFSRFFGTIFLSVRSTMTQVLDFFGISRGLKAMGSLFYRFFDFLGFFKLAKGFEDLIYICLFFSFFPYK
jgi:hypothetical protein